MLERVGRLGWEAPLRHNLRLHQLRQGPVQRRGVQLGHRLDQLIGKGAPEGRAQLRHHFHGGQAVQARHQGVVEGCRDRQRGQRARQLIVVGLLAQQARLQHGLEQLFHKQGHTVGLADHLLEHRWG